MSDVLQSSILIDTALRVVEQKIAGGSVFNGAAPALAAVPFVYFVDTDDGIHRAKKADGSVDAGDAGGLFTFAHDGPIQLVQLLADFGAASNYTLSVVTANGATQVHAVTGVRYATLREIDKVIVLPGESLKLVCTSAVAAWARLYVRMY